MNIRQEESTPIGDYFHDSGAVKIFERIKDSVDEFDVDTDELNVLCDTMISTMKGLKCQIKKAEAEWNKNQAQQKLEDLLQRE